MSSTTTAVRASGTSYPKPYEGTWDPDNQRYLLPNLVGVSFDKMVRNGEGARHGDDPKYYRLILLHGLFAAFAFLILTPAALICSRFLVRGPRPRLAMRGHIGFQIASVLCLTVTFPTGYYAVGKGNWGKNPHHAIGATIYAAMIFQLFFGTFVRWRLHKKIIRKHVPLYQMLHQWLGRATFLLGVAQIPLGLYVYGSPKALFVLYAVIVGMFGIIWFVCEYLREQGYFAHSVIDGPRPVSEMAEGPSGHTPVPTHDVDNTMEDPSLRTPKKSRFSKLSWLVNRRQTFDPHYQSALDHDAGFPSVESSRVPSAQSPAMGGLYPRPQGKQDTPPVPPIPVGIQNQYNSSGSILQGGSDKGKQTMRPPLSESALRNSTTLGPQGQRPQPPLQMPESEAFIPQSPQTPKHAYDPYSALPMPNQPYAHDTTPSPVSPPRSGSGFMEADTGFVPSPVTDVPVAPLPMRPHRRDRSFDSQARTHSRDNSGGEASSARIHPQQQQPNISVQVKLNPDKSVSVRRLQPDEAEKERRERARQRQQRALEHEIDLERERQARATWELERERQARASRERERERRSRERTPQSHSASRSRSRQDSADSRIERLDDPRDLQPPYTPSIGGQSSTIAHASGGLLGRPHQPTPTPMSPMSPAPGHATSPLVGMTPMGRMGASQRESVVSGMERSGTTTAENSEMEQEIVKEQRRKRREKGGWGSPGPETQWT